MALVGTGFRHLAIELEKLVAYIGEKSQITRGAVESAASHLAESTIFMLVDAIGERRADQALRYLAEILREEAPPYVLFMIARQFRMLLRTCTLLARPGQYHSDPASVGLSRVCCKTLQGSGSELFGGSLSSHLRPAPGS